MTASPQTAQGARQASVRAITGSAETYAGDWHKLFDLAGIPTGTTDERLLRWLNLKLSASYTNLPEAQQALATANGAVNWSSMGTFDASTSGGLVDATLDNSTILDKSATWTKVGTLSGNGGTWALTDDASGHFVVLSGGELRVGLVTPDRGSATSHNITVRETVGADTHDTTLTITVTAITVATLGGGGSMRFPRRNGEVSNNSAATSVGLYGLFGANVAGGADGTLYFFVDFRRGSLVTNAYDRDINSSPYVWGMGTNTVGRGLTCRYFPEDSSTASGNALRGRLGIAGKDHSSVNNLGNYLNSDKDGSPSGGSGAFLRSPVISNRDVPYLIAVRYTKNGATWNGVSVPGLSHQVVAIPLDTLTPVYETAVTHSAWVGIGTSASKSPALTMGARTGASAFADYFPGRLSDWAYVSTAASDTDLVSIASGVSPVTQFGNAAVLYWWPMSSSSDLAQSSAATLQQTASSLTVTGSVFTSQQMRPSISGSDGIVCLSKGDGYVFGLSPSTSTTAGATSTTITQRCYITGAATHVQARVTRQSDNAIIKDYARVSDSAVNGDQTFNITGVPIGYDYAVELKREDNNVVAINQHRIRVGFKAALVGQSQNEHSTVGDPGQTALDSVPTTTNVTFCVHRPGMQKARRVDLHVLDAPLDIANGMHAMMERLGSICPSIPWMFQLHSQSGESLGTFYTDQIIYPVAGGGDGTYRAFGDYSTAGSGLITDILLTGGKDITFFLHMHGTADLGLHNVYTSLQNALYAGVSDGNEVFSNTPSTCSIATTAFITAGSISGTTMTVTSVNSAAITLTANLILSGTGITAGTKIVNQLTNTSPAGFAGREGTYTVDTSQTVTFSGNVSVAATDPDSLIKTTAINRYYAAAGLTYPIVVGVVPIQKHAYVSTGGSATQNAFDTFRSNYHDLRSRQRSWSPAGSVTMRVACYTHDVELKTSIDTAHQIVTDVRGNARIDRRYAMGMLRMVGLSSYDPEPKCLAISRSTNVLTVTFSLPNGGSLYVPSAGAPIGAEVSEDGGATWHAWNEGGDALGSNPGTTTGAIFTAAVVGNTMTLTKKAGNWAANTRFRFMYGGPVGYFSVSQSSANRTTNYGYENADNDSILYESRTDAAPSNGSGIVQGVPIIPTFTDLIAA